MKQARDTAWLYNMMDRGTLEPGKKADLILIDGDPISDVRILQDQKRILAIMKDGKFHKAPQAQEQRRRLIA